MEEPQLEFISYAIKHFAEVSTQPEFLQFSSSTLNQILSAEELNVDCEFDIFQAIMRWYEHAKEERQTQLPQLIASIRLIHFDPTYIAKYVKPLVGCEQIADDVLKWVVDESTQRADENLPGFAKSRNDRKSLLLILNDVKKLKYILRFNRSLHKWVKCFEFKFFDYSYGLGYHEGHLFFIGGRSRGVRRNNTVKRFDLKTLKWLEMAKMSQSRDDLFVVMIDEKMYAFGGHDGGDPFNTAEVYDIRSNLWHAIPAMSQHRYGAGAIVYENKIYIFGGLGIDCEPLSSVECYDPVASSWEKCENMHEARGWPGVTILDGFIYIIGGFNEGMLSTAERFDPKANKWEKIAPLCVGRFGSCAITAEHQIWALGGHDTYTTERYDCVNDKWVEETPLPVYGFHSYVEVPNNLVDKLQTKFFL